MNPNLLSTDGTPLREREKGEDYYDYYLYLINEGRSDYVGNHLKKIQDLNMRRILGKQIQFVQQIMECMQRGDIRTAMNIHTNLVETLKPRMLDVIKPVILPKKPVRTKPPVLKKEATETNDSPTRQLLLTKIDAEILDSYPPATLAEIMRLTEGVWTYQDPAKNIKPKLRLTPTEIMVFAECHKQGEGIFITISELIEKTNKERTSVGNALRFGWKITEGTGWRLEIRKDTVCLRRANTSEMPVQEQTESLVPQYDTQTSHG